MGAGSCCEGACRTAASRPGAVALGGIGHSGGAPLPCAAGGCTAQRLVGGGRASHARLFACLAGAGCRCQGRPCPRPCGCSAWQQAPLCAWAGSGASGRCGVTLRRNRRRAEVPYSSAVQKRHAAALCLSAWTTRGRSRGAEHQLDTPRRCLWRCLLAPRRRGRRWRSAHW